MEPLLLAVGKKMANNFAGVQVDLQGGGVAPAGLDRGHGVGLGGCPL